MRFGLCPICHGYDEKNGKNKCICSISEAVERLKIERDAIIRSADNAQITYNKQIDEFLTEIYRIRLNRGYEYEDLISQTEEKEEC